MSQLASTYEQVGPIFLVVGNLIDWLLHGVLTVQFYLYFLAFPNDKTWTKAAVYTVYFLETLQVIGLAIVLALVVAGDHSIYDNLDFATGFGELQKHKMLFVHALLVDLIGGIVPLIAQFIYAHRVEVITQKKVIPWLIRALAVLQLSAAIATGLMVTFANCAWTGLNALNDLIIAIVMVRTLMKEKTLSRKTRRKIKELVYLIVETGSLTVAVNFIALASFATRSHIPAFLGIALLIILPKLYANSILVMLNNRMTIGNSKKDPCMKSAAVLSALVIADQTMFSDTITDV